jgi:putative transposase
MIRILLTDDQRTELRSLRQAELPAVARTRLEVVFLSDAGWSAPRIARHPSNHPHAVRSTLKSSRDRGVAALYPAKPGPEPGHDRRATVTGKLRERLGQERTWARRQPAEALGHGIRIGRRQTRGYLTLLKAGYRRTAQTAGHEQDTEKVQRAKTVLSNLKTKSRRAAGSSTASASAAPRRPCRAVTGVCRASASV